LLMANMSKQNIKELELEILKVRTEMDLLDPIRNDADERAWKLLSQRYNELWSTKIDLERQKSERTKIAVGVVTPAATLGISWIAREIMQSAFWKDLAREITSPFRKFS